MGSKDTVKTSDFIKVLKYWGLQKKGEKGSHQRWSKAGMRRPVIIRPKDKEMPNFHIRSNLKTIGKSFKEFQEALKKA